MASRVVQLDKKASSNDLGALVALKEGGQRRLGERTRVDPNFGHKLV